MTDVDVLLAALDHDAAVTGADIPLPGPWAADGRCRTAPTSLFFPVRGSDTSQAKALCAGCVVLEECRAYALAHPGLQGIWGGLSGRERRAMRGAAERDGGPDLTDAVDITPPERQTVPNRGRPRQRHYRGALYRTLAQLAEHPGQWARVGHWPHPGTATTVASLCRTGRRTIPPGTWTFESRRADDGGSDLYARLEVDDAEGVA